MQMIRDHKDEQLRVKCVKIMTRFLKQIDILFSFEAHNYVGLISCK